MMSMSEAAKKKRAEYMKEYREKNHERIKDYNAEWRSKPENKEKMKVNQQRYWERLAAKEEQEEGIS